MYVALIFSGGFIQLVTTHFNILRIAYTKTKWLKRISNQYQHCIVLQTDPVKCDLTICLLCIATPVYCYSHPYTSLLLSLK